MTKTKLKHKAQDELMSRMAVAFLAADENDETRKFKNELEKQFRRVEKLFGYIAGSVMRGA